jgi:hypothetical protein
MVDTFRGGEASVRGSRASRISGVIHGIGLFLIGMALPMLMFPTSAVAHIPSDYNAKKWNDADMSSGITVSPDDSLPGGLAGAWFDRVQNGYASWNALCCVGTFNFFSGTSVVTRTWGAVCNDNPEVVVYFRNIGGLGLTQACFTDNGRIRQVETAFDSDRPWYTGTGDVPTDKYDAWAVATHEMGHATGTWYQAHFTGSALCPDNSTDQTMCPSMSMNEARWRSLEWHDEHTFQSNY